MAKIIKNKATGLLGFVLIEHEVGVDVVCEDGSWGQYPASDLDWVGETDKINIPSPSSPTAQREIIAAALSALGEFKKRRGERMSGKIIRKTGREGREKFLSPSPRKRKRNGKRS